MMTRNYKTMMTRWGVGYIDPVTASIFVYYGPGDE